MKRWLWYNVGLKIWRSWARTQPLVEVERNLGWMKLDCKENKF